MSLQTYGLAYLLCVSLLPAQSFERLSEWRNVLGLQPGRRVVLESRDPGGRFRGTFASADEAGITVQLEKGGSLTLAKARVRKVLARRERLAYAPLIGAAAGGAVLTGMVSGVEDIVFTGKLLFVAIGAGIGALAGWGVHAAGRHAVIYENPKP